jgi:hypothetical protein
MLNGFGTPWLRSQFVPLPGYDGGDEDDVAAVASSIAEGAIRIDVIDLAA